MFEMNETAFNAEYAEMKSTQRVQDFLCDLCASAYSALKGVGDFAHD
jgi:hypothetical protein